MMAKRTHSNMSNNDAKSMTVKFNVGGTTYEVSRSLLERHPNTMLSRMASETWQKDQQETLFIERDGQRFRYVLDFMRDGRIRVPGGQGQGGITKYSLLDELKYFCFEGVDPESILVEFVGFDAPKHIARLTEDFETEQKKRVKQIDQLNVEISSATVAHACCIRMMEQGCTGVEFSVRCGPDKRSKKPRTAHSHLDHEVVNAVKKVSLSSKHFDLSRALEEYGLFMRNYYEHRDYRNHEVYMVTMDVFSISD